MKILFTLALIASFLFSGDLSAKDKTQIEHIAKDIFTMFYKKDYNTIKAKYIHPKYGYYFLYRIGVPDVFSQEKNITTAQSRLFEFNKNSNTKILWQKPKCLCDDSSWNKKGIFIYTSTANKVQNIMKFMQQYENAHYTKAQKQQAKFIESENFVLVNSNFNTILHIKKIKGKWYITHIDTTICDCSA